MSNPPDRPFWMTSRMVISPSAHFLELNDQAALFCDRAQRLFHLNPTAAEIWSRLADEGTCLSIVDHFKEQGLSEPDAYNFVAGIVEQWLAAGHILPADVAAVTETRPQAMSLLSVGPLTALVRFFGNADVRSFDKVFGHLQASDATPRLRFDLVERSRTYFLIKDGQPSSMTGSDRAVPLLKAALTEACCEAAESGFLAHGALLSRDGKRVFVTGAPGAGKTTLTMALLASGFSFCGDDIVHIDETGQAVGLPFAAAVKSGAWDLLAPFYPELRTVEVHERPDGQLVRYFVPSNRDEAGARPVDAVVVLSRDATSPARTEHLQPLEALCEILGSGYSPKQRLDAPTIRALAENLCRASCIRLTYSDLAGAVPAIIAST